jgi:hypothetical protein
MYDFYDYKKEDPISDIEYVRGMYEAQVHKVKASLQSRVTV